MRIERHQVEDSRFGPYEFFILRLEADHIRCGFHIDSCLWEKARHPAELFESYYWPAREDLLTWEKEEREEEGL